MRTILLLRGLPGSGKSHIAASLLQADPARWRRVSRDYLRAMLLGQFYREGEASVRQAQSLLLRHLLREGFDVILDNTHLNADAIQYAHDAARAHGHTKVIDHLVPTPLDLCLARNKARDPKEHVPDDRIREMAQGAQELLARPPGDVETVYEAPEPTVPPAPAARRIYRCCMVRPTPSNWHDVEADSWGEAANEVHANVLEGGYRYRADEGGPAVFFAMMEVEGFGQVISRYYWEGIWRRGGVRHYRGPSRLDYIAKELGWVEDPRLLLETGWDGEVSEENTPGWPGKNPSPPSAT